jgi:NAD(P)H-hydrate epimerase
MRPIVTAAAIAEVDARAQEDANIPALILMESAGLQAWQHLQPRLTGPEGLLLFLVGAGNNGGDALVVSRYAYNEGYTNQKIYLLDGNVSPSSLVQRRIIEGYGIEVIDETGLHEALRVAHWIIDGIAGTGLKGALRGTARALVEQVGQRSAHVFSIDIPSGLGDQVPVDAPSIHAALTVTMGARKSAMFHPKTRSRCGAIVVVNPSFPPSMIDRLPTVAQVDDRRMSLAPLKADDYKNSRGHVAIFGASPPYSGALRLSGRAAFASRAGLVTLACDEDLLSVVASEAPSVMVRPSGSVDPAAYDVLLAGPGWGSGRSALLKTLMASKKPMVIDADGITTLAELVTSGGLGEHGPLIITPHLGELKRLASSLDVEDDTTPLGFFSAITEVASRLDALLVVKSSLVHIVLPDRTVLVVEGCNPSLGVAGSGDVLSGIIAALWATTGDDVVAARCGVQIHQEAGRRAHAAVGYYDSEHLAEYVGRVVQEAER